MRHIAVLLLAFVLSIVVLCSATFLTQPTYMGAVDDERSFNMVAACTRWNRCQIAAQPYDDWGKRDEWEDRNTDDKESNYKTAAYRHEDPGRSSTETI